MLLRASYVLKLLKLSRILRLRRLKNDMLSFASIQDIKCDSTGIAYIVDNSPRGRALCLTRQTAIGQDICQKIDPASSKSFILLNSFIYSPLNEVWAPINNRSSLINVITSLITRHTADHTTLVGKEDSHKIL